MARPKFSADRFEALEWLLTQNANSTDECYDFIFEAPMVRFLDNPRAPHWINCYLVNGAPSQNEHPVQTCRTPGCINGKHRRWGTYKEAMAGRVFPSRVGAANPAAKFTELEVAQLKSVNWGNGMYKKTVAEIHGVDPQTLHNIISSLKWKHVKPYVTTSKGEGDEF